jgi:predicted thioesterase
MTSLMQLLMDFTCTERLPRYLDHVAYDLSKSLETKHLAALKEGLSGEHTASLERYQQAWEDSRSLELKAMFLAAFSIARELR